MGKAVTLVLAMTTFIAFGQTPKVSSGTLQHFEQFKSDYVDARNVDVWLPDDYSSKERYPVLYMHDGQMLFDASLSWNGNAWEVDETAGKLIAEKKAKPFIVVAVWNNGLKRHGEYFPQKPYETLTVAQQQFVSENLVKRNIINQKFAVNSDNYLKFLVNELKPFIDATFATKPDAENTFTAGSSMGGLISLYAVCEYPGVFGGAACLSTHWPGIYQLDDNPIPEAFYGYLKQHLPNPKNHKIYFDYGDQTLDALYPGLQKKVDVMMKEKGFSAKNWETKFFPGKNHSESAWRERLFIPLEFLFRK